jgi:hypothetical protein
VRSRRDSIHYLWIVSISSISQRGKDGVVPNFRRGRWHAGWLLVSHRGDDVRRARDSNAQMQFASVGGGRRRLDEPTRLGGLVGRTCGGP